MKRRNKVLILIGVLFFGFIVSQFLSLLFLDVAVPLRHRSHYFDMNSGRTKTRRTYFGVRTETHERDTPFSELADRFSLLAEPREERWRFLGDRTNYLFALARGSGCPNDINAFNATSDLVRTLELYKTIGHPLSEDRQRELVAEMLEAMRNDDPESMEGIGRQLWDDMPPPPSRNSSTNASTGF